MNVMFYECHITCNESDSLKCEAVASAEHWKTSEIARDPVLGSATYFYLTTHDSSFIKLFQKMKHTVGRLHANGVAVIREKIELIVHDSKLGVQG